MAAQHNGLKILYAVGLLVNLGSGIYTFYQGMHYLVFFNAVAVLICGLRLRDLFRQTGKNPPD